MGIGGTFDLVRESHTEQSMLAKKCFCLVEYNTTRVVQ